MSLSLSRHTAFLMLTVLLLGLHDVSLPQSGTMFNQRDDKYRLLGLKRAKEMFEVAQKELNREKELFTRGLVSQSELDRVQSSFADAEVNYQQSLLAVLFEQQYVTVLSAVKCQAKTGEKTVRLRLANMSGGSAEMQKLVGVDDRLFRSLQPDVINNVYVSLQNADGAIIGQPYETKIPVLRFGQPKDITFALLQDVDAVSVSVIYGSGTERRMKIFLQKDASANKVVMQSEQFSQEGELGKTVRFDFTMELFSRSTNTFRLFVVGLPAQLYRLFRDPVSNARIGQFRFNESVNSQRVALEVSLPDRPTSEIVMDRALTFFVLAVPQEQARSLGDIEGRQWTQAELEHLGIGYLRLELMPHGKGRLLVRAPQLFQSIRADGSAELNIDVVNEGTRRLDNVEVKVDPPMNWTKTVEPSVITTLDINEERRITIRVSPPKGESPGRYEIRLRTSAISESEPVNADDKAVTVEIQAETSIAGTAIIIILILGLVGGIVYFGMKISRR